MTAKTAGVVASLALVVLIIAGLLYYYGNYMMPSTSPIPSPSPSSGQLLTPTDQADLNWAGYSVASNFSDPQPVVTGVWGSWVVPQVQISQNDTFSAVWVGIGGIFGHTLIQTGTEQDCVGGTVSYSAWYELLPSDSVTITSINVSPGDEINASITLMNSVENLWSIYLADLSTGQSFSHNFLYGSSRLSAEWVVERPDVNNDISEIANFGNVTMSDCMATMNGKAQALGYFPSTRIFMYDTTGTRLADVSAFGNNGSEFTVTYLTTQ